MPNVLHPEVTVNLSDSDGNAYAIIAACLSAARRAGVSIERRAAFQAEATTAGDYDSMLRVCFRWFDIS